MAMVTLQIIKPSIVNGLPCFSKHVDGKIPMKKYNEVEELINLILKGIRFQKFQVKYMIWRLSERQ